MALLRRRVLGFTYWEVPGGHVEPGESAQQAAVREIREELGIDLRTEVALHPAGRVRAHRLYAARISGRPDLRMQGPEVARSRTGNAYLPRWVPQAEVQALRFLRPGVRRAVVRALRAPG